MLNKTCFFVVPVHSSLTGLEILGIKNQIKDVRIIWLRKKGFYFYTPVQEQETILFERLHKYIERVERYSFIHDLNA